MRNGDIIVDADVHNSLRHAGDLLEFLPKVWHEQWMEMTSGIYRQYYSPVGGSRRDTTPPDGGAPGSDPEFMLEHLLDAYGIDYAVLSTGIEISLNPDPDYANAVASAYNDWMLERWVKHSRRFKGSILINTTDPNSAAREIERMAVHPGMVQVIMTSASRMLYGQRFFHPIYEAAQSFGVPVAIHPGGEGRGVSPPPTNAGYPTRYFEWHNILPVSFMAHLNSMVCEGVFEKYPRLQFVAVEGGISWLPHLMWRMDKNYKALRASVPWLKELPSTYIKEHVYLTTQPIEEPPNSRYLEQIFEMIDAKNSVMFASDYPHWDFDDPVRALPPLHNDLRRRIMGGNAMALYRIKVEGDA